MKAAPAAAFTELTTQEWRAFIQTVSHYCPHLYLFGGEPFVRRDVVELIRAAHARRMVTGINTNGTLLQAREVELVDSGLDYMIVSLDGPEDIHDAIRSAGVRGFHTVTESLERCVTAKRAAATRFPLIETCMTLTEDNQAHLLETARIAKDVGADLFSIQLGTFTTAVLEAGSSAAFAADFGSAPGYWRGFVRQTDRIDPGLIARQLLSVERMWGRAFKRYPPFPVDLDTYYRRPEVAVRPHRCQAPWSHMQVLPNGDIAFCEDFPDLIAGNIRDGDALATWNGARATAFRRRIAETGTYAACSRCCSP